MKNRHPTTFCEWRNTVEKVYRGAFKIVRREAIAQLCLLKDHDYEGPEVSAVWGFWTQWETELAEAAEEGREEDLLDSWLDYGLMLVQDAVIEHFGVRGKDAARLDHYLNLELRHYHAWEDSRESPDWPQEVKTCRDCGAVLDDGPCYCEED